VKLIDVERRALESAVNAMVKLALATMEELAAADPNVACEPVHFNELRTQLIRTCWTVVKQAVQYGRLAEDAT
jgi:hypothetical protein